MVCSFTRPNLSSARRFLFEKLTSLGILLLSNLNLATAQSPKPVIRFDQLTRRIDSIVRTTKTPGVQVLVFTKDSVLYKHNAGVMNLRTKAPVTDETIFRLGSITKSFVAVSALMLAEKGELALSDELKKLAPEIQFTNAWEATDPIRVVHLLEHTTGFNDWGPKEYAYDGSGVSLQTGLTLFPESRQSRWRPGTFMAYSNWGTPMVARLIEKKTGKEFEQFVRQRIFDPLGMKRTTFRRDGAAQTHLVTGYLGDERREDPYWDVMLRPAGSLNASALELMPFVQMLMNRGTYRSHQLLQPASVDRMETPTTTLAARTGSKDGFGLHNYTRSYKGYVFHGHDGSVGSGLAQYLYNSDLNLGFVVLVNADGAGFFEINDAIWDALLADKPQRLPPVYALSSTQKIDLLGYYRQSNIRIAFMGWLTWLTGVMRVYEDDNTLFMKDVLGGEAVPLRPIGPGQFLRLDKKGYTTQVTLARNDTGQAVLIRPRVNATETSAVGAWLPIVLAGLALLLLVAGFVAGFVWLIQSVWRIRKKDQKLSAMPVRMALWAYALSFAALLLINETADARFDLGRVTPISLTIFVLSIGVAVFAIWAFISLVRRQRQIPHPADRLFLWAAVLSALLVVGYFAVWGLIGIRTWA